jgi:Zn-dependent alcohol dehydrogenase
MFPIRKFKTRATILRVTTTAICGSDLHIYEGYIPTMKEDDILGPEFMGVVEEGGSNHPLRKVDRVLIPFRCLAASVIFASERKRLFATTPIRKAKVVRCTATKLLAQFRRMFALRGWSRDI